MDRFTTGSSPATGQGHHRQGRAIRGTSRHAAARRVTGPSSALRGAGDAADRAVEAVYWEHLHPEALYQFRVRNFGPLTVAMDSHGRHLYEEVKSETARRLPGIYRSLGIPGGA
jgi:tartrate dehydratase beta subunit/fumarate hydratase class I family protein